MQIDIFSIVLYRERIQRCRYSRTYYGAASQITEMWCVTNMKRWIILPLLLALCLCTPAAAADPFCWTDSFSYRSVEELLATDFWELEGSDLPMGINGQAPNLCDGHLILAAKQSVALRWSAIPEIGPFDPQAVYTLAFDLRLLEWEGHSGWVNSRELYVGAGGWYNFLELRDGTVNTANSGAWEPFATDQTLHVEILWQGTSVTTSVYGEDGSNISLRQRSRAEFVDMEALSHTMERWVFRCEDGSIALSDLSFTKTVPVVQTEAFPLEGRIGGSGVITLAKNGTASLAFDGGELLRFHNGMLQICGVVEGYFPAGDYPVTVELNFPQKNARITLTLPDGRILRRGDNQLLGSAQAAEALVFTGTEGCSFTRSAPLPDVPEVRQYALPEAPAQSDFDSLAWNLTSAFDGDGKTTRSFAWTAHLSMTHMAVRFAEASCFEDPASRILVDAVPEAPVESANRNTLYYKADLTGLSPGTAYTYQIGDTISDRWSDHYTFVTEGLDEDAFSFLVLADTQATNWDGYRYTAAALEYGLELAPDARFLLHGGDLVQHGSNEAQWTQFFRSVKGTAEKLPLFAAIGNHDAWSETSEKAMGDLLFDLHFNHPNNGGVLSSAESFTDSAMNNLLANLQETFYSFDYGNVHVVVLNSGTFVRTEEDNRLLELQRKWLEEDLAASQAKWTVALMHQGVYHRYNPSWFCNALQDLLEEAGVDLVLHGHEHIVKRTYPIRDGKIVITEDPDVIPKGDGTVYLAVGSTTPGHDHVTDTIEECLLVNGLDGAQATCTVIRVDEQQLSVEIRSLNGMVVDAFTIRDPQRNVLTVEAAGEEATLARLLSGCEAQATFRLAKGGACTVMAAAYGADGRMLRCMPVFSGGVEENTTVQAVFRLPEQPEAVHQVQVFLLQQNTCQPLCAPWQPPACD